MVIIRPDHKPLFLGGYIRGGVGWPDIRMVPSQAGPTFKESGTVFGLFKPRVLGHPIAGPAANFFGAGRKFFQQKKGAKEAYQFIYTPVN